MPEKMNRLGAGRRSVRQWTQDELNDMKANYKGLGWREMMRRLGRSKGSITGKAVDLGLSGTWQVIYVRAGGSAA